MPQSLRAISYTRVSTTDQASSGLGLDAQTATIDQAIDARGWTLTASLTDAGASGGNIRRPGIAEALRLLDAGEADVLVVAKQDRLSRSVLDFAKLVERAQKRGWSVVALDVDVDMTTPTGKMVATVMAAMAQMERELIGVRTAEALQVLKARGVRLGAPVELPDDVRVRIAAERASGRTLQAIADGLTADGVPTARGGKWWPVTVAAVVKSVELDAEAARVEAEALEALEYRTPHQYDRALVG